MICTRGVYVRGIHRGGGLVVGKSQIGLLEGGGVPPLPRWEIVSNRIDRGGYLCGEMTLVTPRACARTGRSAEIGYHSEGGSGWAEEVSNRIGRGGRGGRVHLKHPLNPL